MSSGVFGAPSWVHEFSRRSRFYIGVGAHPRFSVRTTTILPVTRKVTVLPGIQAGILQFRPVIACDELFPAKIGQR